MISAVSDPCSAINSSGVAATCANCHGTNGVAQAGNESLAGVNKDDLLKKMLDFKTGKPYWVHDLKAAVWGSTYLAIAIVETWGFFDPARRPAARAAIAALAKRMRATPERTAEAARLESREIISHDEYHRR